MLQALLCELALRDILHGAVELEYGAIPVPERRPAGNDPGGLPLLRDHFGIALVGLPVHPAALDGLGHRVPPLLSEVFSDLGIDGRGEGRIPAIDAIDLR